MTVGYDTIGPRNIKFLQLSYWKGILEALESIGCTVYVSRVGSTASLQRRAFELKTFLEELSQKNGIKKFNLIGHRYEYERS
jgi:triacylglycerol esterase/lipase EstA (alpha/beta hydrolase family)